MPKQAMSIVAYKVIEGGKDAFLALVNGDAFHAALRSYPGFISYGVVNTDGDNWCEYVHWESLALAQEGAKLSQQTPANTALNQYLDPTSFKVQFVEIAAFIG